MVEKIAFMESSAFKTAAIFRKWLAGNHGQTEGIWLQIFKKDSGVPSVTYAEALDEALCYGWIDGQRKPHDARSWIQKFTPRRARSGWSKINRDHVARLTEAGRMQPSGLKVVAAAQADGRWASAYDSFSQAAAPADFLVLLESRPLARTFFATLNKTNLYSIVYRLQTAKKPATRERRMQLILAMLERGEKFHP